MGSVFCASQFGYGVAACRKKTTGVHTPGGRAGNLKDKPGFSILAFLVDVLLSFSDAAMRKHITTEKRRIPCAKILGWFAIKALDSQMRDKYMI